MALSVCLTLSTLLYDRRLFYICGTVTCAVFAIVIVMLLSLRGRTRALLKDIALGVQTSMGDALCELPTPVITVYDGREIVWYNELCAQNVFGGKEMRGADISLLLPGVDMTATSPPEGYDVGIGKNRYTAFVVAAALSERPGSVIYLIDDTRLKFFAEEYHRTKPRIALMAVDNYDELVQDYKDAERARLMSEVEQAIERYFSVHRGFVVKISRDKFMAVIEEQGAGEMLAGKFDLLDAVRNLSGDQSRMSATLSAGVSAGSETLYEAEQSARQALDMCLGRGGDQAAVKTQNGYEFYGGVSKAIEKRTKVKTRIIASALAELIASCPNVVVMGHRFADLDCMGAAVGLFRAVRSMGKPCSIVVDKERNLVGPLMDRLLTGDFTHGDFVSPAEAPGLLGTGTLLIVMDCHVPRVLESEELYRLSHNVVVIDHHRKLVGHIDNAVIFYHEPYASSTAEMVTELVQYFPKGPTLSRIEAEALMAGIMLDTKNFVMRTGVRTFEAAAFLRKMGADTVEVRKLFASSIEQYRQKSALIAGAAIYGDCAISTAEAGYDGIRLVAPQAADEMLAISGVAASFVIYPCGEEINVSARSMGAINVQLIMEKLGGGGHQTMAAAQFKNTGAEAVRNSLTAAIDAYYGDQKTGG
jgi:c-di-AMP phosphodiesterase-like protein